MGMTRALRPLCLLLLIVSATACQRPEAQRLRSDGPPFFNPLPIPDAPNPRISVPRNEPAEVQLLIDDAALAGAICRDGTGLLPASGTLFGHYRFNEPGETALANAPPQLGGGSCQQVHQGMAAPLATMIAAANAENPAIGQAIMAISCYRSMERQAGLFCDRPRVAQRGYSGQARWIAPPGYSEHATGLSIDFGSRREDGCNLHPCFANTDVGRWLAINAPRFGFELSFPANNPQGVSYEPWHYRYIGSMGARSMFDRAATVNRGGSATAR
jgi:zinc D-Ala-D-Ala carboxypeptidase